MSEVLTGGVTAALDGWLDVSVLPTPYLVVDIDEVLRQYDRLAAAAPDWSIHYAVKALPERRIVSALAERGSRFDVASRAEAELCVALGVDPARCSYGNPIKKPSDIVASALLGIDLFSFDCADELGKLAAVAQRRPAREPLRVMCRVLVDTSGSDWPLNAKFGCEPEMAVQLLVEARRRGLAPWGVAFHVGSQQHHPARWIEALGRVARIYEAVAAHGIQMPAINVGGGLPAHYIDPVPTVEEYVGAIEHGLEQAFRGVPRPHVIAEPGRYLVADAGVLRTRVVTVSTKRAGADVRWVYVDTGRYGALAETAGEAIKYRLRTAHDGVGDVGPVILAGPTCDSADILYQRYRYQLPLALQSGDHIDWLSAGAYTTCYSAAWFNGLTPPPVYFVQDGDPTP